MTCPYCKGPHLLSQCKHWIAARKWVHYKESK